MDRIILALDVKTPQEAIAWMDRVKEEIHFFKVGSQLFTAAGPDIIAQIHARKCEVFLDLKFYDIPNTVAKAVREATQLGVWMLNVHASGGCAMMKAVKDELALLPAQVRRPLVIGVTVLTSWDDQSWRSMGCIRGVQEQVLFLSKLVQEAGLQGVVASAEEAAMVRKVCGKGFLIVTPGIRLLDDTIHDQKRVMTPQRALAQGADYIVIGRPILEAKDPLQKIREIKKQIEHIAPAGEIE